ncbi:MAG: hypothetical protein H6742_14725 [Alphaproteobacteria bacterium]|nr:hypothetical protein [Alphaproteobacteria bacterium]
MDPDSRPRIGLEVHVRLATGRRLFSTGPLPAPDGLPNRCIDPYSVGAPGTLPVLDAAAVRLALRAALALSFTVAPVSRFDRKHYHWPDLPKGYQITQGRDPLARDGALHVAGPDGVALHRLERLHLEEDAGTLRHGPGVTAIDLDRAGAPLVEIVGAPDLDDADTAERWLAALQAVLVAAGVTEGRIQHGELRVDANLSLPGGPRVELKNLGGELGPALRHELARQRRVRAEGGAVRRETRRWTGEETVALREKEEAIDYRWLPEPDLPPLRVSEEELAQARAALPAVPLDRHLLAEEARAAGTWQAVFGDEAPLSGPARALALQAAADADPGRVLGLCRNALPADPGALTAAHVVAVAARLDAGMEHRHAAPQLAAAAATGALPPAPTRGGLTTEALDAAVHAVVDRHPDHEARWRAGNAGMEGFFMGQLRDRLPDDQPRDALAAVLREVLAARRDGR